MKVWLTYPNAANNSDQTNSCGQLNRLCVHLSASNDPLNCIRRLSRSGGTGGTCLPGTKEGKIKENERKIKRKGKMRKKTKRENRRKERKNQNTKIMRRGSIIIAYGSISIGGGGRRYPARILEHCPESWTTRPKRAIFFYIILGHFWPNRTFLVESGNILSFWGNIYAQNVTLPSIFTSFCGNFNRYCPNLHWHPARGAVFSLPPASYVYEYNNSKRGGIVNEMGRK